MEKNPEIFEMKVVGTCMFCKWNDPREIHVNCIPCLEEYKGNCIAPMWEYKKPTEEYYNKLYNSSESLKCKIGSVSPLYRVKLSESLLESSTGFWDKLIKSSITDKKNEGDFK